MKSKLQKGILPPTLFVGALGVVFGDIGTSPLYAFRESLHGLAIDSMNVLGILSLIFWTFVLVISLKYIILIMRADNNHEGGVLALYALLRRHERESVVVLLIVFSILGASLLFSDGILTPAMSVLSAMEGVNNISPSFAPLVQPLTVLVLGLLFWWQRKGTGHIGKLFGPIMVVWFAAIAAVGVYQIHSNPYVLSALNPYYAWQFFAYHRLHGILVLSGVFLVITGGEALYADMGHFGKRAIRQAWFAIVMPALVLNYFGQGAYILLNPFSTPNPFYNMVPHWANLPMVILATIATVIASQAVIAATFSLAMQSISLDFLPKLRLIQTSIVQRGQIYVPFINVILAIGTILLVLIFKDSSHLASAYGLAVNLLMLTVSVLVMYVAILEWRWSIIRSSLIFFPFLIIDLLFLTANFKKLNSGAWLPLVVATISAIVMLSWLYGIKYLRSRYFDTATKVDDLKKCIYPAHFDSVFIADPYDKTGNSFIRYLTVCEQKPRHILIVNIEIANQPYVHKSDQVEVTELTHDVYRLVLHYGFTQNIDIPMSLKLAQKREVLPFSLDFNNTLYFIEHTKLLVTYRQVQHMYHWQKKLFGLLIYNAATDIHFYHLPFQRTVIIGNYCEM